MSTKTIYIQPETDAALSKLGGKTRAENLRRVVALAEVAGELAEVMEYYAELERAEMTPATGRAQVALDKYKEAEQ